MPTLSFLARCFWGALASLLFQKGLLLAHLLLSQEGAWDKPRLLLMLPLVFGADVAGALLATGVTALATLPALLLRRPFGARLTAAVTLGLLGILGALSTMGVAYAGGPLNRQSIESAFFGASSAGMGALAGSIGDYVTLPNLLAVAVAGLLPVAFLFPHPAFLSLRPSGPRKSALTLGLLVAAVAGTFVFLPPLQDGRWARLPLATQVENNPYTELLWSYTRPLLREATTRVEGDPFRLDLRARYDLGPVEAPIPDASPGPSNVLVVVLESVGQVYLDGDDNPMPFLASLAKRPGAVRFGRHFTTWTLTTGALFSLLCSELPYPSYKPITIVNPTIPIFCLSEAFRRADYATAYVSSQDLLWDRLHLFVRGHPFDRVLDSSSMPGREGAFFGKWGIDDALAVDAILALPEWQAQRPFFLLFQMVSGHHPYFSYPGQEQVPAKTRQEEYFRALAYADTQLRRLFEGLEARGVLDDTLVLVVSDHGEGVAGGNVGRNIFQPSSQVPAIMFGPQLSGAARELTLNTNHLDLAPTLLALTAQPQPCNFKGRNLLKDGSPRISFFGSRPPQEQVGLVDGPWKFILENDRLAFLFNLADDPSEATELSLAHPELVDAFRRRLLQWRVHTENLIEDYATILKDSGCR